MSIRLISYASRRLAWWRGLDAQTRRYLAVAFTFLLGSYGFYVAYQGLPNTDQRLTTHLSRAFQLVLGNFPDELDGRALPASLVIARFLLPALAWWATIYAVWLWVRNSVLLMLVGWRGNHIVVAGDEGLAARIAAGERKRRGRVMILPDDHGSGWVSSALDEGAPHIDRFAPGKMKKLCLDKARLAVIVGKDEAWNLEQATALLQALDEATFGRAPIPVIVRIDDPDLTGPVDRQLKRIAQSRAQLRLISLPDVEARRLFLDHPLDRIVRAADMRSRIFIFGASPLAERYMLRVLAGAHFRSGLTPVIVIFDPHSDRARETMLARTPALQNMKHVSFVRADVERPALIPAILEMGTSMFGPPTFIIVDPATSGRTVAIAAQAAHFFAEEDLPAPLIHYRSASQGAEALSTSLFAFGTDAAYSDPEVLLQEDHDRLARAIHDSYFEAQLKEGVVEGSRNSMHRWDRLSGTIRDDNRLAADLYELKLRDIGARVLDGSGEAFHFLDHELEELAEAEHRRWRTTRSLGGWTLGDERDDARKKHPDLVPYGALSERVKELDRQQVRNINALLPRGRKRAVRDLQVSAKEDLDLADVKRGLHRYKTANANREVVVSGNFHSERERNILILAQEAGCRIQLVMESNADNIIDACSSSRSPKLKNLVRSADRVYVVSGQNGSMH